MNAATLTFIPSATPTASESPSKTHNPDSASSTSSGDFSSVLSNQQQKHSNNASSSNDATTNNSATHSAESSANNHVNASSQPKTIDHEGDEERRADNDSATNQVFVDAALFIASEAKALQSHKPDSNATSLASSTATTLHTNTKGSKSAERNEARDATTQRLSTTVPHTMHTAQHDASESLAAVPVSKTTNAFDATHTTQLNRGVIAAAAHSEPRPTLRSSTNAANSSLRTEAVESLRRQPALADKHDFSDTKLGTTVRFQDEHHLQRALTQNLRHDTLSTATLSELSAQPGAGINMPLNTTAGATALNAAVNVPLTSPQWGQEFGRQMLSLTRNLSDGSYHAELRLDPPELGPLRISLKLSDNIAHAHIVSAHANVRSAVEQALPQLQQALSQAGLSLGDAGVSDQGLAQNFANQHGNNEENDALFAQVLHSDNSIAIDGLNFSNTGTQNARSDALIDTFA